MNKYQNGKIYKIISEDDDEVYIGSTMVKTLCIRFSKHQCEFKAWKAHNHHYVSSFKILEKKGPKIILIENYPCNNKDELRAREQYWIDNTPNCVNKHRAMKTEENKKEDKKIASATYYESHTDAIKEKNRKWKEENKDKVKEWYEANKEKYLITQECECGGKFSVNTKSRHITTKKHQTWAHARSLTKVCIAPGPDVLSEASH